MEDSRIIALYQQRSEQAVAETEKKYGTYCRKIACGLLQRLQDVEECLNDTWHAAWRRIPPEQPRTLSVFLGRITRNLAISRFRLLTAQKRNEGAATLLSELEDCIPAGETTEEAFDRVQLGQVISHWLESQKAEDRALFLRRYWYGESLQALAQAQGIPANRLAHKMARLRKSLRVALEEEGVIL